MKKIPTSKIVDTEVAELMAWAEGAERDLEALQGDWQGKFIVIFAFY